MEHPEHAHVLHKHCINACTFQLAEQPLRGLKLAIVNDRVDRNVDFRPEPMGVAAQFPNVAHRIASFGACAKTRCANIDGIRAMVYCSLATFKVAGRCEKFELFHHCIVS